MASRLPDLPQVACSDTVFHRRMPDLEQRFSLSRTYGWRGYAGTASIGCPTNASWQPLAQWSMEYYRVCMDWCMRVVRVVICIGLFMCLLSASLVACGINSPPVKTLEQWERDRNRTRSRE
jgi:hypothetical protein